MASATLNYGFPYPVNTDPVDIAGDIQALAEALDVEIKEINQDSAAEMITGGTHTNGISVSYNDPSNTLSFSLSQDIRTSASPEFAGLTINGVDAATVDDVTSSSGSATANANAYTDSQISALDTDDIEEGLSNLYFTDSRAISATESTIASASAAAVSSANSYTDSEIISASSSIVGQINSLTTDDISEGSNEYYTDEKVDDRVSNLIVDGNNIVSSYNDESNTLTISLSDNISVSGSVEVSGNIVPSSNSLYSIGTESNTFSGLYLSASPIYLGSVPISTKEYINASSQSVDSISFIDITINNSPEVNEVDGTSGIWSLQAGSGSVFLINRSDNKKYAISMTEIT